MNGDVLSVGGGYFWAGAIRGDGRGVGGWQYARGPKGKRRAELREGVGVIERSWRGTDSGWGAPAREGAGAREGSRGVGCWRCPGAAGEGSRGARGGRGAGAGRGRATHSASRRPMSSGGWPSRRGGDGRGRGERNRGGGLDRMGSSGARSGTAGECLTMYGCAAGRFYECPTSTRRSRATSVVIGIASGGRYLDGARPRCLFSQAGRAGKAGLPWSPTTVGGSSTGGTGVENPWRCEEGG